MQIPNNNNVKVARVAKEGILYLAYSAKKN
jgi:hypothetical protein